MRGRALLSGRFVRRDVHPGRRDGQRQARSELRERVLADDELLHRREAVARDRDRVRGEVRRVDEDLRGLLRLLAVEGVDRELDRL